MACLCTVWYTAIVMYYTLVHVTKSGYASDFIKNISTLSNVPMRSFYISIFMFIALFCFVSIRPKLKFFYHHQMIPIFIELGFSLILMKNISFSATCILFIVWTNQLIVQFASYLSFWHICFQIMDIYPIIFL